jgi:anhydro-N-acetylmuramic acid kinase
MVYYVIGTMSGSSIDGLDIAYCRIEEVGGKWNFEIEEASCIEFDEQWKQKLTNIAHASAKELLLTHAEFGHWMGKNIHQFIEEHNLTHKVHLIASHGHTVFHEPALGMTFQMGDGASIAAETQLPVVSDLRNLDVALGGQGAPIVPIGEQLFWSDYQYFLNIGGISNLTIQLADKFVAFDVCPANRILNLIANEMGMAFDKEGIEASKGSIKDDLLNELNDLDYYQKPYPKSLSNQFGLEVIFPIIQKYAISNQDKLRTMCEHIAHQIAESIAPGESQKMLVTGGGAFNTFLMKLISEKLLTKNVEVVIPDSKLIQYKEALVMALIGTLRWREENNVLSSVTGASRNSVGGALWMGQE